MARRETQNKKALVACVALVAVVLALSAEAKPWKDYLNDTKSYLVGLARNQVISRSTMLTSFDDTVRHIREAYDQAKAAGELEGLSEEQKSDFYYKIVIKEVKNLRVQIEENAEAGRGLVADVHLDEVAQRETAQLQKDCPKCLDKASMADMDMDLDDEGDTLDDELRLMNELSEIQKIQLEAEMGWAMSEETRAALKARTKQVLGDLLSNEVRQLAMAIIASYMVEGPIGPVVIALQSSLKLKVMSYIMNCIMDVLGGIMGSPIQLTPPGQGPAIPAAPAVEAPPAAITAA